MGKQAELLQRDFIMHRKGMLRSLSSIMDNINFDLDERVSHAMSKLTN